MKDRPGRDQAGYIEDGREVVIDCPTDFAADAWDLLRAADLAEKGHWPVAGGWLDQVAGVVDAVRYVWQLEAELRAET